jgi:hypothetical protein
MSYEASGGLRTVERFVAHDAEWKYELETVSSGTEAPMARLTKRQQNRGW